MADILSGIGQQIGNGPALAFLILMGALIVGPRGAELVRLPAMVGLVLAGMVVGPHGLRILDTDGIALSNWGTFGLLYLMFAAGLELDLKLFARMKKAAITFAVLSFLVPCTLGIVSARVLGYAWAAAILMGSNWGSHTLVTYPLLRQVGLARNRAVGTVIGATAVTDTSALLVLTGVVASVKKVGGVGVQVGEIVIGLAVLAGWSLYVLPRVARWFFARVGTDASYRFVFGIVAFLIGAVIAQAASIDGIVGAFFAGLGLNRAIPEGSSLMDRVQFFGSGLFIPIFLVSVGILLDPRVLVDPKTLLVALVFTIAVLGGKALAAVLAGRRFGFTWPEIGVMSGLSGSQAAATLATTLVGAKLGIFDKQTINAVLVVILASLIVTPAVVTYFAKKVERTQEGGEALASTVLVPVWGEATRPLLRLAGRLAQEDGGLVMAASFAAEDAPESELDGQRALRDQAEGWLAKEGLESKTCFRVARSVPSGLFETVRAEKASLLVSEWRSSESGRIEPDSEAFRLLVRSPVPVLIARGSVDDFDRVLVLARREDLVQPGRRDFDLAAEVASRIAAHHKVILAGPLLDPAPAVLAAKRHLFENLEVSEPLAWARTHLEPKDLLILPGVDAADEALRIIPDIGQRAFLVAVAAHPAAAAPAPEVRSSGLVVGRTPTHAGA
jgi:Kef-type K+ transport system membrane component KefB